MSRANKSPFILSIILTLSFLVSYLPKAQAALRQFNVNDGNWMDPVNWDDGNALEVPLAAEGVEIIKNVTDIDPGKEVTVLTAGFYGAKWDPDDKGLTLNATDKVTFSRNASGPSRLSNGTINGDTDFYSSLMSEGTIYGNVTFNKHLDYDDPSRMNNGTINGETTFNNNSILFGGTINGETTFNDDSRMDAGTINGETTFNDESFMEYGTINGDVLINSTSYFGGIIQGGTITSLQNFSLRNNLTINSAGTISNNISEKVSNKGSLTKGGTGILTLSGNNTYSQGTEITSGTLAVGSANALGTGKVTVKNGATLDIGLTDLTIGGVYTQDANSNFNVTINGNTSGSIQVSNKVHSVSENANLNLTITGYVEDGNVYTIIQGVGAASGINAPNINFNSAILSFEVTKFGDSLEITATRDTYDSASSGNAAAAGAAFDRAGKAGATGDMADVLNELDTLPSAAALNQVLGTTTPAVDAGVLNASNSTLNNFIGASLNRMRNLFAFAGKETANSGVSAGDEKKLNSIWAKGYGSYLDQDARKGASGYSAWNSGTAFGIDRLFSDVFTLGISAGYAYGKVNSNANSARTSINSAQGTIYAGFQPLEAPYYIDATGSFAWNWYDSWRSIDIGGIHRIAKAEYDGQQYSTYIEGGYKVKLSKSLEVTPLASLQWSHLNLERYSETSAGSLSLNVDRQSYDILQSGLGIKASSQIEYKWGNFIPELHLKWLYDFINDDMVVTSSFNGGGGSFTSKGAKPARHSFNTGGKFSFELKNDISLIAECNVELKDRFVGIYGSGALRYKF